MLHAPSGPLAAGPAHRLLRWAWVPAFCALLTPAASASNALYRPDTGLSAPVILVADPDDPAEPVNRLASALDSLGCALFLEMWNDTGERPGPARRADRLKAGEEELVARIDSLARAFPAGEWVLGASGRGAAAAIRALARMDSLPAALFLVSPQVEEPGLSPVSILVEMDLPVLILAVRAAPGSRELPRDLFVHDQPGTELWTVSGGGPGASILKDRDYLVVDLADWVCGKLSVSRHTADHGDPAEGGAERGSR